MIVRRALSTGSSWRSVSAPPRGGASFSGAASALVSATLGVQSGLAFASLAASAASSAAGSSSSVSMASVRAAPVDEQTGLGVGVHGRAVARRAGIPSRALPRSTCPQQR